MVFAFLGDVRRSSRALRQLRALEESGLTVHVIMVDEQPNGAYLEDELTQSTNVRIETVVAPKLTGPSLFWNMHKSFKKVALERRAPVYFASDLYTLPAMAAAATAHQGKLVYDSRELYTDLDSSVGRPWVRTIWGVVERRYIKKADLVITVTKAIATRLASHYQIEKPFVSHNVPELANVERSDRLRFELGISEHRRIVLYQGGLREGRGLPQLIRAVAEVDIAHLVLIGDGPLELEAKQLASVISDRASFLPFTLPDELRVLTASADLGVALIEPLTESLRLALPNKLFEYLMAGTPVLASTTPEIKHIVDMYDVGILSEPDDHDALVEALRTALTDETQRAQWRANAANVLRDYSWEREKPDFQKKIHELLN